MRRLTFIYPVVFLALSSAIAQTPDVAPVAPMTIPLATQSQAECTGFIADPEIPRELFVLGGGDDDFHDVSRQFVQRETIFITGQEKKGQEIALGTEYRVIRPAHELFRTMRYSGERGEIGALGKPYEDVARVRVTHVNPAGVVALVAFSCQPIMPGDTLIPFQPRAIPEYTLSPPLDHFAPLDNNKPHGRITASRNNFGYLGAQTVVYLNLGEQTGAKPGARYRIYKLAGPHAIGFLTEEKTPPETIGEAVVLSVQSKSCVAMVVSSYREISSGDYVEAE